MVIDLKTSRGRNRLHRPRREHLSTKSRLILISHSSSSSCFLLPRWNSQRLWTVPSQTWQALLCAKNHLSWWIGAPLCFPACQNTAKLLSPGPQRHFWSQSLYWMRLTGSTTLNVDCEQIHVWKRYGCIHLTVIRAPSRFPYDFAYKPDIGFKHKIVKSSVEQRAGLYHIDKMNQKTHT